MKQWNINDYLFPLIYDQELSVAKTSIDYILILPAPAKTREADRGGHSSAPVSTPDRCEVSAVANLASGQADDGSASLAG